MAAESVVSSVVGQLGNLLKQEVNFLSGVSRQVEQMQRELKMMQSYLEDADKRHDEEKTVHTWVSEIREAAYDAQNVIETYVIQVESRRRGGIRNTFKRYACILGEANEIHKVGSEITAIMTRISKLNKSMQDYGIKPKSEDEGSSFAQCLVRRTYSHVAEEYIVGLGRDVEKLVAELVNEEKPCRVVSICGMGGLGKTTLAKKIYHNNDIRRHFDGFAWVFVSQQHQTRYVWERILFELISPSKEQRDEIKGMADEELAKRLYKVQQEEKKCLVVLDDIWTTKAWDSLHAAFPTQKARSRLLLTTRNKDVALHADPRGFLHEPSCLNEKESWELLQTKVFSQNNDPEFKIDTELEILGKEMIGRCKGLPLAIVVLSGILATKHTSYEWKKVLENIKSHLRRGKGHGQRLNGVPEVLALSYHELPYYLKPCFLHLGHFREDFDIPAKKLFKLWVAEGIVSPTQYGVEEKESLEDVAECYLNELIQRCMVQVGERGSTGTVKICRLHDLMREFCLLRVNQENFLKVVHLPEQKEQVDYPSSMAITTESTCRVRRLAIHSSKESLEFFPQQITTPYIQSLLFFDSYGTKVSQKMISQFSNFKLLKVLDFEKWIILAKLPRTIGKLVHLRYLSFNCEEIISIPSSIGNLRSLQTLILMERTSDNLIRIPNVLWKMEQLRHLYLPTNILSTKMDKLRLGNLSNLLTLQGFDTYQFDVKELSKLRNLKKLGIGKCKSLKEFEGILISPNASLNRLRSLRISRFGSEVEETDPQGLFSGCAHLCKLRVGGQIRKLPEYPQFPPNLTKLILVDSGLKEDPMPTLEKLPNLTILRFEYYAFVGKEMVCSSKGFPQLKSLLLYGLPNLKEWSVSDEAMPTLCQLKIVWCEKLKMIPDGLRFITTLHELEISLMPEAFTKRVRAVNGEGGEDSHKLHHVPSIIFKD